MARELIILGSVGNCLDIVEAVCASNEVPGCGGLELVGFLDDDRERQGTSVHGLPVLGPLSSAVEFPEAAFVNGIGSPGNHTRKAEIIGRTGLATERFATVVHPSAAIGASARIGRGVTILGNVTVNANVTIGDHVMILPNCVIGHDSVIGDYSTLAAGVTVSGAVNVGASCYLGAGAAIKDGVRVGDRALLGMGSALIKDMPPDTDFAGNPARLLKRGSAAGQFPE